MMTNAFITQIQNRKKKKTMAKFKTAFQIKSPEQKFLLCLTDF